MRQTLISIIAFFVLAAGPGGIGSRSAVAQEVGTMNKPRSGIYKAWGSKKEVYLFDDDQFIYGDYETAVIGKYSLNGENLTFEVVFDQPVFTILGRWDPKIKTGTKISFERQFRETNVFVKFDDGPFSPVFDTIKRAWEPFYTTLLKNKPQQIILAEDPSATDRRPVTLSFPLNEGYNDYLITFNRPAKSEGDTLPPATLKQVDGKRILVFKGTPLPQNEIDPFALVHVKGILSERAANSADTLFYYTEGLREITFKKPSINPHDFDARAYLFSKSNNKYLVKDAYKNRTSSFGEKVKDENVILVYRPVLPSIQGHQPITDTAVSKTAILKARNYKQY